MNKTVRVLLGVFLVLLAIVLAVRWWPEPEVPELRLAGWGSGTASDRADEDAPIDRIDLAIGSRTATLTRVDGAWRLTPPEGALADRTKVRQILSSFEEDLVSFLGTPAGTDEATFGLDPNQRVQVTLKRGDVVVTDLDIGLVKKPKTGPGAGDTFVRVPGSARVWRILDRDLRRPFDDGTTGLRDRRVLAIDGARVTSIALTNPRADAPLDRRIVLASDAPPAAKDDAKDAPAAAPPKRTWRITAPEGHPAADVDRLIAALASLYAQEWLDDVPENVDLGPEAFSITITLDDQTTRTVRVSEIQEDRAWVRADGVPGIARISRHAAESLRKRLGDLRDKSLVGWTADRIAAVEWIDGKRQWHFARDGNGFTAVHPKGLVPDREAVRSLMADIARLKADRLVPAAEAPDHVSGLDAPSARLVVTATDGQRRVIRVGRTEEGRTWARIDGTDDAAVVPTWMADRIRKDAQAFRNRKIFPFEGTDIARIRIVHPDETLSLVAKPTTDDTTVPFAIEGRPDELLSGEVAVGLVSALVGLVVRDFPATAPDRLDRPELRVVVTLNDGARYELRIAGKDADGNPYGVAPNAPGLANTTFTLSPQHVEALRVRASDLLP
jgi:hypothetical protein